VLPIVQRELHIAARSRAFYAWRLRIGILLILLAAMIVLRGARGGLAGPNNGLFYTLSFCALLLCLVEGIRKTSDTISEEKREGTLGLLFLTTLTGFDVILGKLTAAAVRSLNALLAFVPLLAVTLLLGGVTGGEFWRTVLVLIATLAASLSLCILASTLSRERSLGVAAQFLLLLCFLPFLARPIANIGDSLSAVSPFRLLNLASDAYFRSTARPYWTGLVSLLGVSLVSICLASFLLPRVWRDKAQIFISARTRSRQWARDTSHRRQMLDQNPAMWLLFDPRLQRVFHGFVFLVGAGALIGIALLHFLPPFWNIQVPDQIAAMVAGVGTVTVAIAAFLYVGREASRNLAEARQNGSLELVLSTPLKVDEIIRGQLLAIRSVLRWPTIIFGCLVAYLFAAASISGEIPALLLLLKGVIEAVVGIFAIARVGIWMALTSKGATRAYLKTLGLGLIFPFFFCLPTVVNQIVLLAVAVDRVQAHFRRYVADRYLGAHSFRLSPVSSLPPESPPVLRS
jgi:ABC-type transport system involved in multi-copper enzyme maturation permease subunit